jgi:hypothetical protein
MTKDERSKAIPVVSRVAGDTLIELVYDPQKKQTGLVVSRFGGLWNIEQEVRIGDEVLVPYSASNNLISNECIAFAAKPFECGFKHELLEEIRAFLHRYVDLSPTFEQIAAHYILLTWVFDRFSDLPLLRLRGEYGTGKTRGIQVIGALCYKAFFASGASTMSPVFHIIDSFGGTLVLDEADFRFSDKTNDLVKLLNNSTTKGLPILRTIFNRHKEFNPHAFRVFGPKIVAMRGAFEDDALESRFITEETAARSLRPDIPIHLPASWKEEALTLRNKLLHFRVRNFFSIETDPTAMIEGAEPRLNQSALALLSLIDDPDIRLDVQGYLLEANTALRMRRSETVEAKVASTILAAWSGREGALALGAVAERFNADYATEFGMMSNRAVGNIIRARFHIALRKSNGVYVLPASERTKVERAAYRLGVAHDPAQAGDTEV